MKNSLTRPLLILAAFACGCFFPELGELKFLIRYLLILMLFISCLKTRLAELLPQKAHLRIFVFNLLFPLVLWGILHGLGWERAAKVAFFTAVTPTAAAAPVVVRFLGGSSAFAVTSFVLTNLGISFALLFLLPLVTGDLSFSFFLRTALNIAVVVGIPVAAAAGVRHLFPEAEKLPAKLANFSFGLWILLLLINAGAASEFLHAEGGLTSPAVLGIFGMTAFLCAANFGTGALFAPPGQRLECSQCTGQKNTSLTIFLALEFADPATALGPMSYMLWHNLWNAWQLFLAERGKK